VGESFPIRGANVGDLFCPNCMSPYLEPVVPETPEEEQAQRDEPLLRCTECEYTAPRSEFVPENYR
jgi:hypothetical protein